MVKEFKIINIEDLKRKDAFLIFSERDNPHTSITTEVEITNILKYTKQHKNFYALMSYVVMRALNMVEEFKYRLDNGKILKYNIIDSSITDLKPDGNIGFFNVPYAEDYETYLSNFKNGRQQMFERENGVEKEPDLGEFWISTFPWATFSAVQVPVSKDYTIPQIIWGKYFERDGKMLVNIFIFGNHCFMDGSHIGAFINNFNQIQQSLEKYL